MREIKYRAWDGESVRYDVTGFEHGIKNEMAGIFLDGDYYSLDEHSLSTAMNNRHAVAMQFTGLKDKNSKEIYEGDIVHRKQIHSDGSLGRLLSYPAPITFKNGSFCMEYSNGSARPFHTIMANTGDHWEVIGNIYENPELLDPKEAL